MANDILPMSYILLEICQNLFDKGQNRAVVNCCLLLWHLLLFRTGFSINYFVYWKLFVLEMA